jgi:hypothetical protein
MKQVNEATQNTLENFRRKASELPPSAHPYVTMREALSKLGKDAWDEENRSSAINAMAMWVMSIVGGSAATVLNEIVALMRIAAETGDEEHKKAADEMASSMKFVEDVFKTYLSTIDTRHVAESLFEDGLKAEKERLEEEAAAEAAKAKVKAHAEKQKQEVKQDPLKIGTVHTKWQPSVN